MTTKNDNRIYIGNLPQDVRTKDIEDLFYKYGKIKYIDLKNRKGPPFAFVEFEDPNDADEAIEGRDGYNFEGHRLRVELQKGPRTGGGGGGGGGGGIGGGFTSGRGRPGPPTRRSDYRCIITGLPPTGSWQDLKDHMREAGNVCYADVFKDGTGVVEFIRYDDMKYAVRNLDDTKFRSHEGETSYVRVKMDYTKGRGGSSSRSRSRSSSYSRKRRHSTEKERATPSYSPVRRSRSPDHDDDDDHIRRSSRKRNKKSASRSRSRSRGSYRRSRRSRSRSRRSRTRSRSRSHNKRFTRSRSTRSHSKTRTSKSKSPHSFSPSNAKTNGDTENGHEIHENNDENGNYSEKDD